MEKRKFVVVTKAEFDAYDKSWLRSWSTLNSSYWCHHIDGANETMCFIQWDDGNTPIYFVKK